MLARPATRLLGRACWPLHFGFRAASCPSISRQYATVRRVAFGNPGTRDEGESEQALDPRRDSKRDFLALNLHGVVYSIDKIYLRDACSCPRCVNEHSHQKLFETTQIPEDIDVTDWSVENISRPEDGQEQRVVHIKWRNDIVGWEDHVSTFSLSFIRSRYRKQADPPKFTRTWNASNTELLDPIDYESYLTDPNVYRSTLRQLGRYGLVLLNNVPESERSVELIAGKIGPLRDTFYGRTWDVKDKPKAENVAYTAEHLGLHMDLLYFKQPPGLQLLHCLKSSCEGGESMFSDSFNAAEDLRRRRWEDFRVLSNYQTSYRYDVNGHFYSDSKPTIEIARSKDGRIIKSRNNKPTIRNINWSPPFQDNFPKMRLNRGREDPSIRDYHRAASEFSRLIHSPENMMEHRLSPGECVIFNNRRVLHGRKAFQSGIGERWLKGAYLNVDEFLSALSTSKPVGDPLEDETANEDILQGDAAEQ